MRGILIHQTRLGSPWPHEDRPRRRRSASWLIDPVGRPEMTHLSRSPAVAAPPSDAGRAPAAATTPPIGQHVRMAKWRGVSRTAGVIVAALLIAAVNVVLFTWLYAPIMLALEFAVFVFAFLAASIIRSACCHRNVVS